MDMSGIDLFSAHTHCHVTVKCHGYGREPQITPFSIPLPATLSSLYVPPTQG